MKYQFEHDHRLRVGLVGCGGHAFRNIAPTFAYAPIDLVCTCDRNAQRAADVGRLHGARRHYEDHQTMLSHEDLDAVFLVLSLGSDGRPQYPALAVDAVQAGCHVWMEKPPAASVQELVDLRGLARERERIVFVGFKKQFTPAVTRMREILDHPDFGSPTSIVARYPQSLPPAGRRHDARAMAGFLDHVVHPGSLVDYLMPPIEALTFHREPTRGATVAVLRFQGGAVGALHLACGQSGTSPLERVEVIGEGSNVILDNGVHLTWHRSGARGSGRYGREPSYLSDLDSAPLVWEPEFSLGQLYNKGLFLLGYVPEVVEFAECALQTRQPTRGGLDSAIRVMRLFEAFRDGREGEERVLASGEAS